MRTYIVVYNVENEQYRIAFRDENDPIGVYFVETDIGIIKNSQLAEQVMKALNRHEQQTETS